MSRPTLDAAALAARMNARPLPEDCDGGVWYGPHAPWAGDECCMSCHKNIRRECSDECMVSGGGASARLILCLPCALADCERAEAAHRSADPHCTCNDCLAYHAANTTKGA